MTPTDPMNTDLERKAEVDSIEYLQHERRKILAEWAALRALHGPGNKWDNRRKQMLSALKVQARYEASKETPPRKLTDDATDAEAHAHQSYITFIDRGIEDATRYIVLDIEMLEISELIENRKAGLYAYGGELRNTV